MVADLPAWPGQPQLPASPPHLSLEVKGGCLARHIEERHHASCDVVCQVAVEQPGARVVCVGIKHSHGTGLNNNLQYNINSIMLLIAYKMRYAILVAYGSQAPANSGHHTWQPLQRDSTRWFSISLQGSILAPYCRLTKPISHALPGRCLRQQCAACRDC